MVAIDQLPIKSIGQQIDDVLASGQGDGFREHLGASLIGRRCDRELWLTFRWALPYNWEGRMLRLFNRGELEEARFINYLRLIGVTCHDKDPQTGQQFRVKMHGHFGGSMDGCAVNVPDGGAQWHVLEFKTHSLKSFDYLSRVGVLVAKPEHYVQMQIYMGLTGMPRALYCAVCKDDDRLYFERVKYDKDCFELYARRAEYIIYKDSPPPKISPDRDSEDCKWCHYKDLCHGNTKPVKNCRTCQWIIPLADGTFTCLNPENKMIFDDTIKTLSTYEQKTGCEHYELFPETVPNVG